MAEGDNKVIMELLDARLTRTETALGGRIESLEDKLDDVLPTLVALTTIHGKDAPHNHTALNCPLAADVKSLRDSHNKVKGATWGIGAVVLLLGGIEAALRLLA